MISVHCNLCLLSSSDDSPVSASRATGVTDACHNNWLIFIFLVETRFHHVDQAGLELLTSETEFHHVDQAGLELLVIHLPWPSKVLKLQA
uniref:Uncharacterized protein n=1 Tax=Callithrix jacchus TaxID=9483 RepID=A0A8I3WS43_CALJA